MTQEKFIQFTNQTRKSLYLSEADEDIEKKLITIMDPEKNNKITKERVYGQMESLINLFAEPGKHTEKVIRKTFNDFDLKQEGCLSISDLRLLFGLICDMIHVER